MAKKIALMDRFGNNPTEKDFPYYVEGFLEQGFEVFQLDPYTFDFKKNKGEMRKLYSVTGEIVKKGDKEETNLNFFDSIVDLSDIVNLDFAKGLSKVDSFHINDPVETFRSADKRTYVENYPGLIPDTLVSSDFGKLERALVERFGGKMIIKDPFSSHGKRVEMVYSKDPSSIELIKKYVEEGRKEIVAQEFLEFAYKGAKRITIVGNPKNPDSYEILYFNQRIPAEGNWKDNLSCGGKIKDLKNLRQDEINLSLEVAKKSGLYTMGLDIMDGLDEKGNLVPKLIETNSVLALGSSQCRHIIHDVTKYLGGLIKNEG